MKKVQLRFREKAKMDNFRATLTFLSEKNERNIQYVHDKKEDIIIGKSPFCSITIATDYEVEGDEEFCRIYPDSFSKVS